MIDGHTHTDRNRERKRVNREGDKGEQKVARYRLRKWWLDNLVFGIRIKNTKHCADRQKRNKVRLNGISHADAYKSALGNILFSPLE